MREGFKETFKPLIESQEAVKTSIDTQQNKLIEQLQKNQLALTEGLEGNRLAITSDFDLLQLPSYKAVEEEKEVEEEEEEEEKEKEEEKEETKKEIIEKNKRITKPCNKKK